MEGLVQAFNAELSTLYEAKPPISKGKMNTITRTAIKAIKMYKHIVQSVERFIAKCKPEYKVPGLYVIDSIVRQSRHQFGYEKDVFGPRFTRNFNQTFQNLFLTCPVEDKPKIVRVLNLWQRNNVFSCDVIQPLLDMANPNAELKTTTSIDEHQQIKDGQENKNIVMQLHQLASSLGIQNTNNSNLNSSSSSNNNENQIRFDKKILNYDYGDDDDDDDVKGETPTESEPPLSTINTNDDPNSNPLVLSMAQNLLSNPDLVQKLQQSIAMQSDSKMIDNLNISGLPFFNLNNSNSNLNNNGDLTEQLYNLSNSLKFGHSNPTSSNQFNQLNKLDKRDYEKEQKRRSISPRNKYASSSKHHSNRDSSRREDRSTRDYRDRNDKSCLDRRSDRRNSRERRHRSRSPRNKKDQLSNSFNSLQQVTTTSQLSPESKEKERERERRKKGLPSIKNNYVTICSTTLWLGHLPKSTTQIDLSDAFGEYGDISSIDLISARGCAYVCMNRRQDAYKALQNLKNLKLNNSHIKMAWAPGKGMKGKEFKDYWDSDLGVSYIPYDKLNQNTDFELLEEGGMLDEESIPAHLFQLRNEKLKEDKQQQQQQANTSNEEISTTTQQPINEQIINPIPVPIPSLPPPFGLPPPFALPPINPINPINHQLPLPPMNHQLPPINQINSINHQLPLPPMNHPILPLIHPNLNEDKSNELNKPPNLFQPIPPNNAWLQPPPGFLPKDPSNLAPPNLPPNLNPNLAPPFFPGPPNLNPNLGPPQLNQQLNNDPSFNNQMFEQNLMMNQNQKMISFHHDDNLNQQHSFNEMNQINQMNQMNQMNSRDNKYNNNWRNKNMKDQRNNRRFNNNMNNNNYNDDGQGRGGNFNKRKNDNLNNSNRMDRNKKFKKLNNKNKNRQNQQQKNRTINQSDNDGEDNDNSIVKDENSSNELDDQQENLNDVDNLNNESNRDDQDNNQLSNDQSTESFDNQMNSQDIENENSNLKDNLQDCLSDNQTNQQEETAEA